MAENNTEYMSDADIEDLNTPEYQKKLDEIEKRGKFKRIDNLSEYFLIFK